MVTEKEHAHDTFQLFDLGTFEGFNFRAQSAIEKSLTATEVAEWHHDRDGEAEFWPAGDRPELSLLFPKMVTASELFDVCRLLSQLGGDTPENILRIYHAVVTCGQSLAEATASSIQDDEVSIYFGTNFTDLRREVAFELFELYYPELYRLWDATPCDGLHFDPDRFLDSPVWFTEEVRLGGMVALLVKPQ